MRKLTLILIATVAFVLVACGNTAASANATTITVDANDFKFEPATVEVKVGQPVKLMLRNNGTIEHDFSVMDFAMARKGPASSSSSAHDMSNMTKQPDLHLAAMMGKTDTLEFTPSKTGTYEFFCTIAGHKESGMVGKLIVK